MRARSLVFTLFGDYVIRYGREIWIGSLIQMLQEFGFSAQAVRVTVSRLTQQGSLKTRKVGQKSYYSLTEKGYRKLQEGTRRLYKEAPETWDGQWRILSYAIPETSRDLRDQLRRELAWLGFAPLSAGTWISPRQVDARVLEVIESIGLGSWVDLFTARYHGPGDDRSMVHRCWNVEEISQWYDRFIEQYRPQLEKLQLRMTENDPAPDNFCFVERTLLVHEYRKFLHFDPGLPRELLPDDWAGDVAAAMFREYYRLLSEGAERFFATVYEAPPTHGPGLLVAHQNGRHRPADRA